MNKIHETFFLELLQHSDKISEYINALYTGDEYSNSDLNYIFRALQNEGVIRCRFADNKIYTCEITFEGKHYFDAEGLLSIEKPHLVDLIDDIGKIERLYHIVDNSYLRYKKIFDVQEFQDWLQEVMLELQDIYDRTQDQFILETLNVCRKKMNGTNDERIFSELSGKLRAIRKNIDRYYTKQQDKPKELERVMNKERTPLIFISHSSKNKEQVKLLADLLRSIYLYPKKDIFCSSLPGYDIPIDTSHSIFDFLRSRFLEYDIYVLFIHSHEYYASPVSLNEMGAAWVLCAKSTSFLLPGFNFADMKGVINDTKIAIKLDNDIDEVKNKLNEFRKKLEKEFNLIPVQDIIWEKERDKFIQAINSDKM